MRNFINNDNDKQAYNKILDGVIKGVIHSILVMLDGEDELIDAFNIDIINADTAGSLKKGIALHEEFFSCLLDVE